MATVHHELAREVESRTLMVSRSPVESDPLSSLQTPRTLSVWRIA
jgi:hypothetical protein